MKQSVRSFFSQDITDMPLRGKWGCLVTASMLSFLLIVFLALLGLSFPMEFLILLSFGWLIFLKNNVPAMQPDWLAVGIGAGLLLVLFCLILVTLKTYAGAPSKRQSWQTATAVLALLISGFATGIGVVGALHQVVWMATSQSPWLKSKSTAHLRSWSKNNLKHLALSTHNFEDAHTIFPPGVELNAAGHAVKSWETALLPYLEQQALFEQIDFSQAWNAETNREVFSTEIPAYSNPGVRRAELHSPKSVWALSDYAANSRVLGYGRAELPAHVLRSQVLLYGEISRRRQPWGQPGNLRDPAICLHSPETGFQGPFPGVTKFVFLDGHLRYISENIDPEVLRRLADPLNEEPIREEEF